MASTHPSAGSRVAHIPELLEQILLEIVRPGSISTYGDRVTRYRTILRSQAVHSTFKSTIEGSKKLQQALSSETISLATIPGLIINYKGRSRSVLEVQRFHEEAITTHPEASWRRLRCDGHIKEIRTLAGWCPYRGSSKVVLDGLDLVEPEMGEVYDLLAQQIHRYIEVANTCRCLQKLV